MAESKTSARRIAAAERRRRALSLRLGGATLDQIARSPGDDGRPLYSSRKRAHEAVQTALREIAEETRGSAEELRTLELARLESMQMALWPATRPTKAVACENCGHTMWREVDKEAVDRVIKIMQRRAQYLGLDAKSAQEDHSKAASMITSILDALADGVPDEDPPAHQHEHGSADAGTDT